MKRSKKLYDSEGNVTGVICFQKFGNKVAASAYLKDPEQKRPLNIEVALYYAEKKALHNIWLYRTGQEKLCTQSAILDFSKRNMDWGKVYDLARVEVYGGVSYIMF